MSETGRIGFDLDGAHRPLSINRREYESIIARVASRVRDAMMGHFDRVDDNVGVGLKAILDRAYTEKFFTSMAADEIDDKIREFAIAFTADHMEAGDKLTPSVPKVLRLLADQLENVGQ